ncbi:MAG TPA: type II toxin-antitoxin system VapC family toxin [Terriglobia bacterium]|nr:type II toxin-antitoxin system VapC family toxin [Terriglobia bacterium]
MNAYADTSFLFSLYVVDVHSRVARSLALRLRPVFILTALHELELVNAMELAVFRRYISAGEARAARHDFERDLNRWPLKPLPADAFARSVRLAERHTARTGARSLDILHVAAALAMDAEAFLTFDIRPRRLAAAEGLRVTF